MKTIKRILLALAAIIVLALVIALFIKKEYLIEREIIIDKPKIEVFDYVKYLKNQDNYSVWAGMDPNMIKEFKGTDGTVGFISAWESQNENVGKGEQEIIKIEEGNRIDYELRFVEPFEDKGNTYLITESIGDSSTKVKWGYTGKMNYPMNLMMLMMNMDKMLGPDLEKGLSNLKTLMEN